MADEIKKPETKIYQQDEVDSIVSKVKNKLKAEWEAENQNLTEQIADLNAKIRLGEFRKSWQSQGGNPKALGSFLSEYKNDLPEKDADFDEFVGKIKKDGEKDYYFQPKTNILKDLTIDKRPEKPKDETNKDEPKFIANSTIKVPGS